VQIMKFSTASPWAGPAGTPENVDIAGIPFGRHGAVVDD